MKRYAAVFGALLLAWPLVAQTGAVRIRVTDPSGSAISEATVSLINNGDRSLRTLSTNDAGEVLWTDLPLGDAHFFASATGFSLRRLRTTIRDGDEQNIAVSLEVAPLEDVPDVETIQMPSPQTLDLPPALVPESPKPTPAKRK